MKTCFVDDCEVEIPSGLLMCKAHWRLVSRPTQATVNRDFRIWKFGGSCRRYLESCSQAAREAQGREQA